MARILVVDDSSIIRDLLTDLLGEMGHQVETASDGIQGLALAREGGYDLCICDMHLPGKNGYQLLTELGPERGDMQFVFTDSLPDELYEKVKENTGFLRLRKPFDLHQMREVLEITLDKTRAR